ncbi:hypothetical protein A79_4410 [Vibrio parahaemolyticus AQ3810]|nr:hypothetical protein A79_4410 [Vibrio parahaemolyticus AQ3810]EQL92883.1 hypothetical protein D035_3591 [Vibrio parahaemolyticus VP250]EQL97171.1 hypothetical protein D040_1655 [Vibrio parahaemolyticus NIHCB0603]EQM45191.1 hypothetical protein D025_0232 [Vibrio parahaemolyticus 949]ETS23836.1 hypothetical protein D033_0721 [Vibrio parahaemolyticus B-265]ETT11946.1 hypothetical protein D026_1463 [Vibrio parahaemolyticus 605]ETX24189.1 hypothetical protein D037_2190 [Vibrio parahaemolyticus 
MVFRYRPFFVYGTKVTTLSFETCSILIAYKSNEGAWKINMAYAIAVRVK